MCLKLTDISIKRFGFWEIQLKWYQPSKEKRTMGKNVVVCECNRDGNHTHTGRWAARRRWSSRPRSLRCRSADSCCRLCWCWTGSGWWNGWWGGYQTGAGEEGTQKRGHLWMGAQPVCDGDHRGLKANVHTRSLDLSWCSLLRLLATLSQTGERRMFTRPAVPSVGRCTFHFIHTDELHYH